MTEADVGPSAGVGVPAPLAGAEGAAESDEGEALSAAAAGAGSRRTGRRRTQAEGRKAPVRWSAELAKALCERLAAGELLYPICREPGMPTPEGVAKWAREKPDFAAALETARRCGGRPAGSRGPVFTYCEETGAALFERLCDGESLTRIGADPTMPSLSTIFYWRRRIPEFEEVVRVGKDVQAERMFDEGWAMAQAATPETAYLTHVRLSHLRWMAGVLAPKVFRLKPAEPEKPQRVVDVLMRRFEIELDPETGEKKVVAYCPNPETGQAEREDTPGWRLPGGADAIAVPGGLSRSSAPGRRRG